jgi:hypothetical protein
LNGRKAFFDLQSEPGQRFELWQQIGWARAKQSLHFHGIAPSQYLTQIVAAQKAPWLLRVFAKLAGCPLVPLGFRVIFARYD